MRMLLDTHVFLWWRMDAPQLEEAARSALTDVRNEIFISAAVAWEIVIKRALGKLEFHGDVRAAIHEEGFAALPIRVEHCDALAALPPLHRDPFDRVLIAQAVTERMTLVTHDEQVKRYEAVPILSA